MKKDMIRLIMNLTSTFMIHFCDNYATLRH